jgi:hypothetical protein
VQPQRQRRPARVDAFSTSPRSQILRRQTGWPCTPPFARGTDRASNESTNLGRLSSNASRGEGFRLAAPVPRLFLAAHRHDEDGIALGVVHVQGDVPTRPGTDHELAEAVGRRPPKVRTGLEDLQGVDNLLCVPPRSGRRAAASARESDRSRRELPLQGRLLPDQVLSLRGFGRFGVSPRTRANR